MHGLFPLVKVLRASWDRNLGKYYRKKEKLIRCAMAGVDGVPAKRLCYHSLTSFFFLAFSHDLLPI